MKKFISIAIFATSLICIGLAHGAPEVPDIIKMPGTQPEEANIEDPGRCLNCHEGYETNPRVEPGFGWLGAAMGNAGRDPIFWATLTIAEQDLDGAGDLCIRCHSSGGWMGGRSTPTDGSGLAASDENGIDCDTCHQMTNPNQGEHIGVFFPPFEPYETEVDALEGYYGSGMYTLSNDFGKLGPYAEGDAVARHMFTESNFHRDVDFCGTCHDVSNSAVGQLAPNGGTQPGAPAVIRSSELGYPFNPEVPQPGDPNILAGMAAFNNPPYAYGIVERTFSEYKSSPFGTDDLNARILVDDFTTLPADLQDPRGSLFNAYAAATNNDRGTANYADDLVTPGGPSPRYFSCQTCHMRAITGRGCDKSNAPNRDDQPMHDQTGGNYWVAPLIQYQDQQNTLRLGGGLTALQIEAMNDGALRAGQHLTQAGTLDVNGDLVRITNMTGHKLISGYPEGRRMWLNIKWYDNQGVEMTADEVGAWGPLGVTFPNPKDNNTPFEPWSIVDLEDPRLKVYEVHPAITQDWAAILVGAFPYHETTPIGFNRMTGAVEGTIGDLADGLLGSYAKSFHFALNNYVADDNRIPPYRMSYDEAQKRNALPVPFDQYGGSPGGVYQHWDEFDIGAIAPQGARSAELTLYYQGTSWEYVQFLYKAAENPPPHAGTFLAEEGVNFLDAWVKTGMVPPHVMATATWSGDCIPEPEICDDSIDNDCDNLVDCADPDCDGTPECPNLIEFPDCFDGLDNDFDGLIDCADTTDCQGETEASTCGVGVCASTGIKTCLSNGTLDDTCTPLPATEPGTELTCNNGLDDDCDGLTDTEDPDCGMPCGDYTSKGDCNMDPNCEWQGSPKNGMCVDVVVCIPTAAAEIPDTEPNATCQDGIDNDCDGVIDCADSPDCDTDSACQVMDCSTYGTKTDCQMAGCKWSNKTKTCVNP